MSTERVTHVYVISAGDTCLYVGASMNLQSRLRQHRQKPWWRDGLTVESFPVPAGRAVALAFEAALIGARRPIYNIYQTARSPQDGLGLVADALTSVRRARAVVA